MIVDGRVHGVQRPEAERPVHALRAHHRLLGLLAQGQEVSPLQSINKWHKVECKKLLTFREPYPLEFVEH